MSVEPKDVISGAALALGIYGAILSTLNFRKAKRKDAAEEAAKAEKAAADAVAHKVQKADEVAKLLISVESMIPRVKILDQWIFHQRIFTRKANIMEGLRHILDFWRAHEPAVARIFPRDSQIYLRLQGCYHVAHQNEGFNPERGVGEWIGVHQLEPWTVTQAFENAKNELQRMKDFPDKN